MSKKAEKQARLLSSLARIRHGMEAKLKLEEISRIVVEELITVRSSSGCAILLIEGSEFRVLAERGSLELVEKLQFRTDAPGIKSIIDTKQSFCTGDVNNGVARDWVPPGGAVNSMIRAPIVVNDQVKGLIHLHSPEKNAFGEDELRSVELMAQEMSIALERYFLEGRVQALSAKDDATGCLNRGKLDEDIEAEIHRAKRYEKQVSLLLMDIEGSKAFQASQEYNKGDELLREIVGIFRRTVRIVDKFYRYGGSEIAIVLPETGKEKALFVAKRLQEIVEQKQPHENRTNHHHEMVSIAIGIASYPEDGSGREELLRSVESALYRAKRSGRNKVHIFHRTWARSWTQ